MGGLSLGLADTHLLGLPHVAEEKPPHALHRTLLQLMGTPLVITNLPAEGNNWISLVPSPERYVEYPSGDFQQHSRYSINIHSSANHLFTTPRY